MFSLLRMSVLGIALCAPVAGAGLADGPFPVADGLGMADETILALEEVLDKGSAPADADRRTVGLPTVAPDPSPVVGPSAAFVADTPVREAPAGVANVDVLPSVEPEVITPELAARVADARVRLDALIAARDAGEGAATQGSIAAVEAVEKMVAALQPAADTLAWRADRMVAYWTEIQATGFSLPEGTVPYEVDRQRPFHERDARPVTTIEVSPRLVYATQAKTTYRGFETVAEVLGGGIAAGEKFLYVGMLRTRKARRVLGWVLGRGQIVVTDNDIAVLNGE